MGGAQRCIHSNTHQLPQCPSWQQLSLLPPPQALAKTTATRSGAAGWRKGCKGLGVRGGKAGVLDQCWTSSRCVGQQIEKKQQLLPYTTTPYCL